MSEETKITELGDEELKSVDGGSGVYAGHRITTGISKGCSDYYAGENFYNKKILAISGTCGACEHLISLDGWHLCGLRNE